MESKVTSSGTAPKARKARRGKAFMARATAGPQAVAAAAIHKPSRSAYPEQNHRDGPCVCHPTAGASWYKTASKAVVAETEPAAPAVSTQNDDDYVNISVSREKVARADTWLTRDGAAPCFPERGTAKFHTSPSLSSGASANPLVAAKAWKSSNI